MEFGVLSLTASTFVQWAILLVFDAILDRGGPLSRTLSLDGSIFIKRRGGHKGPALITVHVAMIKYQT